MATTIAKYYIDELKDWDQTIRTYNTEIIEFGARLEEVIRRDSIIDIAKKVEAHQALLNQSLNTFISLQTVIQQQKAALKADGTFVENTMINSDIENRQAELRNKMQEAEGKYINAKYDCYNFLFENLKKN